MSELRPRKHRCLLYSTEEEHRESVISTVIHGFEKRQKIVYIYDVHTPDTVLGYLEPYSDTGIKSAIDNRQLLFYSSEETYMKSRAFNPDTMLELIQAETERALSEGYAGLLGVGEMTWASSGVPGVGRLVDYEARLNEFLMAKRCSLLCQYDTNRFEDKLLLAVLITHPAVMLGTEVYDNQYFIPPSKFFNEPLPSVVLTERLSQLRERKHLLNWLDKQDQAMKILREKGQLFRTVANHTYDWESWIGPGGEPLWVNPAVERMTGCPVKECLAVKDYPIPLIYEDDRHIMAKILKSAGSGSSGNDVHLRIKGKDGSIRWASICWQPMFDADGSYLGYRTSVRDVDTWKKTEEELERLEQEKSIILDNLPELVAYQDLENRIVWANKTTAESFGLTIDQLQGKICYQVFQSRDEVCDGCPVVKARETGMPQSKEMICPDGRAWFIQGIPVRENNDEVVGIIEITSDITGRKQTEKALLESEERYRTLFRESKDAIYITTNSGQLLDGNQAFLDLFGYSREDIPHLNAKDAYVNREDEKGLEETVRKVGALKDFELKLRKKDGTIIDCLLMLTAKTGEGGGITGYQGIVRDITEKKRAEETIREMAYHDALTGLPNRRLFFDRLTVAVSHAERNREQLAVMMLDLDRFKDVNDAFGHSTGDLLLKMASERLIAVTRKSDTIARLGGDEFLLILPGVDKTEDPDIIARKIIEIFQGVFVLDGRQISITASIGISIYPGNGTDADTLVRNADSAMYRAKKAGRNTYRYAGS